MITCLEKLISFYGDTVGKGTGYASHDHIPVGDRSRHGAILLKAYSAYVSAIVRNGRRSGQLQRSPENRNQAVGELEIRLDIYGVPGVEFYRHGIRSVN